MHTIKAGYVTGVLTTPCSPHGTYLQLSISSFGLPEAVGAEQAFPLQGECTFLVCPCRGIKGTI